MDKNNILQKKDYENKKMKIWSACMRIGVYMGCHQRPDRSFFYHNYQFPVCQRCTGCFVGYILALIIWTQYKISIWLCVGLCMPMLVDWGLQFIKARESTPISRLVTGTLGGLGVLSFEIDVVIKVLKWGGIL